MLENFTSHKGVPDLILNSEWLTYLGVIAVSTWGGIVKYIGNGSKFTWSSLFAQILSSSFAGMMTLLACQYSGVTGPLVGVLCGLAGHLGTPALIAMAMKLKVVRELLSDKETKEAK
jgi:hypothetical protein